MKLDQQMKGCKREKTAESDSIMMKTEIQKKKSLSSNITYYCISKN